MCSGEPLRYSRDRVMTAEQVLNMLGTLELFLSLRIALCLCFIHRQTRVLHRHWDIYPTMDIISIVAILS